MRVQEIAITARIAKIAKIVKSKAISHHGDTETRRRAGTVKVKTKNKPKTLTTGDTEDTEKNRGSKVKGKTNISPRRHGDTEARRHGGKQSGN